MEGGLLRFMALDLKNEEDKTIYHLLSRRPQKTSFPFEISERIVSPVTVNGIDAEHISKSASPSHTDAKASLSSVTSSLNADAQSFIPGQRWHSPVLDTAGSSQHSPNHVLSLSSHNTQLGVQQSDGHVANSVLSSPGGHHYVGPEYMTTTSYGSTVAADSSVPQVNGTDHMTGPMSTEILPKNERKVEAPATLRITFGEVNLDEVLEKSKEKRGELEQVVCDASKDELTEVNLPDKTETNESSIVVSSAEGVEKVSNTTLAASPSSPTPPPSTDAKSDPPIMWSKLFDSKSALPAKKPAPDAQPSVKDTIVQLPAPRPTNEIGAILADLKVSHGVVPIQPRRLINQANWCYINSTLQALLACPPFYHMLKALPVYPALGNQRSVTPVLDAMIEFVNEFSSFEKPTERAKKGKSEMKVGKAFEPGMVYDALPVMKSDPNSFQRGKQEDAEEFLSCLLNTLHEEICDAMKQNQKQSDGATMNGHGEQSPDDDADPENEWKEVGPKNKAVVTHSNVDKTITPISKIFGGQLRSSLSIAKVDTQKSKKESDTLEPFFTVPLNVQIPKSIEEALNAFVCKETIDGYTCPQTKQEVDAYRQLTFDELPTILILHLKCFVYDKHGGSQKVMHKVSFSENLDFEKELLSPQAIKKLQKNQRSYKLFAVVYHSGEKTTGGHYHTDVFHTGERCWVRFDDDSVKKINLSQVFENKQKCVPYLLYYKRVDMMPQQQSPSTTTTNNAISVSSR